MSQRRDRAYLSGSTALATAEVEFHLSELRAIAAADRLARLARGPHPLRRRVGHLLIHAGEALAGVPVAAAHASQGGRRIYVLPRR